MCYGLQQKCANAGIDRGTVIEVIVPDHQSVRGSDTNGLEGDFEEAQFRLDGGVFTRQNVRVGDVMQVLVIEDRAQVKRDITHDDNMNASVAQCLLHGSRIDIGRPAGSRCLELIQHFGHARAAGLECGPQRSPALLVRSWRLVASLTNLGR